ncbi:MAG TPA: GtrA family protein [Acidimicrobiales bacterium]
MSLDAGIDRVLGALPVLGPWYRTDEGRKKVRYALVSVVAVPVGTAGVAAFDVVQRSAGLAAILGNSVGAVPSYVLNRYWVWSKNDKNRLFAEILPFWVITLVGIGFSFYVAHETGQFTHRHHIGGVLRVTLLLVANLAGFGVLWIAKYILFNRVLFVSRHRGEDDPVGSPLP